ncbi:MAG TPA: hypothetical protein VLK88_11120, partial [Gemmatimonadales bacterium]|nr:hypothetical protein [Gemmatimonadales bacterium]
GRRGRCPEEGRAVPAAQRAGRGRERQMEAWQRIGTYAAGLALDSAGVARAREVLARLNNEYRKAYYAGVICERRAKAHLALRAPGAESVAYEWFREAMDWYEKAEKLRPPGNDEAILRWNTCVRILTQNPEIAPLPDTTPEPVLGE